ncbi:MAG: anthranilate phosphoribosyltransferase, partial [Flavisolibacter sp.]
YRFKNNNEQLKAEIEATHFTFMHAPLFHPALKAVARIRRDLGFRTFFNMLGPMVNPARPAYQLVGVFSLELARVYNYLLQQQDKPFVIIHGLDGYDEISLTNDTKVITQDGERIMTPQSLGKRMVSAADLHGGESVEAAARIFMKILRCEGSWAQNAVVLANAAMALHCTGTYKNYDAAYAAAVDSLESGKALASFDKLISMQ